ncbi:MAG: MaoC family dehydratase [Desulfarculus sp.]|jgi:acyl dehydratase|nr:MAG: MaoC family dehydratase [Desulfarculus sp.]
MSQMRQRAAQGLRPGEVFSITRTFSQADTEAFGDLTRDYNPVHYDPGFARVKGFDRLILHGMLTASMICQIGGQIAWLATRMDFRYLKAVHFGDTITCTMTIAEINDKGWARAEAVYTNQRGQVVVTGRIEGQVPGPAEQAELDRMLAAGDSTNKLR